MSYLDRAQAEQWIAYREAEIARALAARRRARAATARTARPAARLGVAALIARIRARSRAGVAPARDAAEPVSGASETAA